MKLFLLKEMSLKMQAALVEVLFCRETFLNSFRYAGESDSDSEFLNRISHA